MAWTGLQQYHRGISFKLRKDITIQIQKVHRIPNRQDQERNSTQHTIVKTLKYREQRKYKTTREHTQTTYKGKLIRIAAGSSMEAWFPNGSCLIDHWQRNSRIK